MNITLPAIAHDALADLSPTHDRRAWVYFDPEAGLVSVDTEAQHVNTVPMDVWHGRTLRWSVPTDVSGEALTEALEALRPQLEAVAAGHAVEWDGSNHIGHLTEEAQEASLDVEQALESLESDLDVSLAWEWVDGGNPEPALQLVRDHGIEGAAREIIRAAEADGVYLAGDVEAEVRDLVERHEAGA